MSPETEYREYFRKYLYKMSPMWYVALALDILILTGAAIFCYFSLINIDPQNNEMSNQELVINPQPTPEPTNQPQEIVWGITPIIPDYVWYTATPTPVPSATPQPTVTALPLTLTTEPTITNVISCEINGDITDAAYAPDGKTFALSSIILNIQIRHAQTGKLIVSLPKYSDAVNSLAYSPDNTMILTGHNDGTARLWSVNGELLESFFSQIPISKVLFTPKGDKIVICHTGNDAYIEIIDAATKLQILQFSTERSNGVIDAALSPDNQWLFTGAPQTIARWRILTGEPDWQLNGSTRIWLQQAGSTRVMVGSGYSIATGPVAVSPKGKYFAAALKTETGICVVIWDTNKTYPSAGYSQFTPKSFVHSMSFPAKKDYLIITGGENGIAQLWENNNNGGRFELIRTFSLLDGNVIVVAFSPTDEQVLIASDTGHVKLFKL